MLYEVITLMNFGWLMQIFQSTNTMVLQTMTPPRITSYNVCYTKLLRALVAVGMLIGAGYMYITANGDEGKVEKATKTLTFAIIRITSYNVCYTKLLRVPVLDV